ncbi:hypothetical protein ACHHYP_02016 [Achlya hypogyna]|uniref:Peptidase S74 domain-containing protein n=1 Tax=Achlya hypogyna TaxID=1202772 RepID=A0A1V9Z7L5_ACHHY|nr:hypothetical protein ACHHYP_02016 [Achlya hypogyna]
MAAAGVVLGQTAKRCPGGENQCSLHGACMINRLGNYVCNCQWGYTGTDCAQKMCPHGFDPVRSETQVEKKLRLQIHTKPGAATGNHVILQFHGHTVEMELASVTSEHCTMIFRRFHNLGDVSCVRTATSGPTLLYEFDITLNSFPIYPVMNNIYFHDGNPLSSAFSCESDRADITCSFTSLTDTNVKAYLPCSDHGACNSKSGLCACEPGFYGVHCGHSQDSADALQGIAPGPFFTGNLLRLAAARLPDASFNLIKIDVAGSPVFTMDGRGQTTLHRGSLTVEALRTDHAEVLGDLTLRQASLTVLDGHVHIKKSLAARERPAFAIDAGVVTDDMTCTVDELGELLRVAFNDEPLLSLKASGVLSTHSVGIEHTLSVGGATAVHSTLAVGGAATIHHGLKVHDGGLQVLSGGAAITGATVVASDERGGTSEPTLHVTGNSDGSRIRLSQPGNGEAAFLTCARGDKTVFGISATGATTVHAGGLVVESGGVNVAAGGQTIQSGGLEILSGGLHVAAGPVRIDSSLAFDGGLVVNGSESATPSLDVKARHAHFSGSVLRIDASSVELAASMGFELLTAVTAGGSVFAVDDRGNLTTAGSVVAGGSLVAHGPLVAETQALFRPTRVVAAKELHLPCTHSYVQVLGDGQRHRDNRQTIATAGATYGQLLVVQNADDDALVSLKIPPRSSALFVFDGQAWQTLTATEFDTTQLSDVQELTAAADLNIGNHMFTAKSVQVAGRTAGQLAWYGKGGILSGDESLAFDAPTKTLSAHQLKVAQLSGKIDMTNSELRGVDIIGGQLRGINLSALTLEVVGEMFVESNAFVGGWLTVDGQVMGSGSYVDSSDARFKTNVTALVDPLERLQQLRGVEYNYRADAYPAKHFSLEREIGFIAQEVEAVLPQVVSTDASGYKYVAYARIVPVAVEAIKAQASTIDALAATVAALQDQVHHLTQLVEQQQVLLAAITRAV